jgi:DNA-binding transcriptional regulator LsrR (DeoR family)
LAKGETVVRDTVNAGDYERARLINRVLSLYYVQKLTQAEVAQRLGLSTTKVNRLLQQAREQGMVEIVIRTPFQHLFDLETRLRAIFDLSDVVVIPQIAEDTTDMAHTLGRAGANYLLEHLRDGDVIGIGGGTAVHAVVQAVASPRPYDVAVVPVLGAVQGRVTTDVNYLAAELAGRLGGRAYQLHAPAFVDTREQRDMLLSMGPIKEILDIARRANLALMGLGTVDYGTSRYVQFTALSTEDMKRIAEEHGGVGEIGGYVYDIEGRPCAEAYANRVVGLTLQELRRIPFVVGVAATAVKALPLYGALRGGHLDALITDEAAAKGILARFERDFAGSRDGYPDHDRSIVNRSGTSMKRGVGYVSIEK